MPTRDDFFEAIGPGEVGYDSARTGSGQAIFRVGADMEGSELGVIGNASTGSRGLPPPRRIGVFGRGEGVGVYGQTIHSAGGETDQAAAIVGSSFDEIAVAAFADRNTAVYAQAGKAVAVHAHSGPPHNFGFFKTGAVTATSSGPFHGVSALSLNFDAVHGRSGGANGVTGLSGAEHGVEGLSFAPPRAPGVKLADAPAGVRGQSMNGSIGVLGVADSPTATSGAGVVGVGGPHAQAGFFEGDLIVTGQISAGIKDPIVPFPDGSKRRLHCMESPEHWFEDFGSARLTRGRVTVKLDADFAKVVKLNEYRVFLTPEGNCQGLYVRKRGTSFEVRELQGGTSNVAFSYRIVAKRKDIKAHRRFAKIDTTVPMPTGKARAARGRQAARLPSSMRALIAASDPPPSRNARISSISSTTRARSCAFSASSRSSSS